MTLTRTHRRIIFWTVVICYGVSAPLLILFASGYRLDIHHYTYKKTGIIVADVLPENATVTLNGTEVPSSLRDHKRIIADLADGTYTIRFSSQQFYPWQTSVTVVTGQASILNNIVLLPKRQPTLLAPDRITHLRAAPSGEFAIGIKPSSPQQLVAITADGTMTLLSPLPEGTVNDMVIAASEDTILLSLQQRGQRKWFIAPARANASALTPIAFPSALNHIDQVVWDPWTNKKLLILADSHLWDYTLANGLLTPIETTKTVQAVSTLHRTLFYSIKTSTGSSVIEQTAFIGARSIWNDTNDTGMLKAIDAETLLISTVTSSKDQPFTVLEYHDGSWTANTAVGLVENFFKRSDQQYVAVHSSDIAFEQSTVPASPTILPLAHLQNIAISSTLPLAIVQSDSSTLAVAVLSSPQPSRPMTLIHTNDDLEWTLINDTTILCSGTINGQEGTYALELDPTKNENRS